MGRLTDRVASIRLRRRVKAGKQPWGRQAAQVPVKGQITARVYRRATGQWEDLGKIADLKKEV